MLDKRAILVSVLNRIHRKLVTLEHDASKRRKLVKMTSITVLPAKSDSDIMFCLQTYKGIRIDRINTQ